LEQIRYELKEFKMGRKFILVIAVIIVVLWGVAFLSFQGKGFAVEQKESLQIYVPFDEKFVCVERIYDNNNVVIRTRPRTSTDILEIYLLRTYKHTKEGYLLNTSWNIAIEELTGMEGSETIKTCEESGTSSSTCFISTIME